MKKNLISLSILFQVLILLFATAGIAAAEDQAENQTLPEELPDLENLKQTLPEQPVILSGDIYIDGEKASVGTSIEVKHKGKKVGTINVNKEGKLGENALDKVLLSCTPEEINELKFYKIKDKDKNNQELIIEPIDAEKIEAIKKSDIYKGLTINAKLLKESSSSKSRGGGGGGGFYIPDEKTTSEDPTLGKSVDNVNTGTDVEPLVTEEPESSSATYADLPEEKTSNKGLIIAGLLGLVVIVGVVYFFKSKNK